MTPAQIEEAYFARIGALLDPLSPAQVVEMSDLMVHVAQRLLETLPPAAPINLPTVIEVTLERYRAETGLRPTFTPTPAMIEDILARYWARERP